MRLVRLGQQPSRVAEDIRAALASLGRGDHVAGGIALIGPRPLPTAKPVDAVVLMPRGVILVFGVDLPGPAIRLEAPLADQWKTDGWPLVGPGSPANPAIRALAQASSLTRQLREAAPESLPIGTIVAVGPFVETVDQPAADLAGNTRVLHPTPTSMLAATVSLADGERPCAVAEVRALLPVLAPQAAQLATDVLIAEGFAEGPATPPPMASSRPKPIEIIEPLPESQTPLVPAQNPRAVRWLPVAAISLLAVVVVTAIVFALTRSGDNAPGPPAAAPPFQTIQGLQFLERASGAEQRCADHAYGDLRTSLQRVACTMMRRGSFETSSGGRPVAVSIAVVYFGDETAASTFRTAADTPGGGGVTDVATETRKWTRTPQFAGAPHATSITGTAVRLVLATWFDGTSSASDPTLVQLAHLALSVQVS